MMTLRPYQLDLIERARSAYARGARAVLLQAPCGAGKTATSAEIMRSATALGRRSLFIAGRVELIDQTVRTLARFGVNDVRIIQAERDLGGTDASVTVGSIDTLTADGWLERMPDADLLIVDEAHHATCTKVGRITQRYPAAKLLGLTATPMRGDRTPLSPPFDALVVGPSVRELTELGVLVPAVVLVPPRGALEPGQLALEPVTAYQRHAGGRMAVAFCRDIAHAIATAAAFTAAGIPADYVDGTMGRRRRAGALEALATGQICVLTSVDVVTEGFDVPALEVAIMARRFGHIGRWLQAVGRVIRSAPGKTSARIIDLCGSAHDHGPPDAPMSFTLDGDGIAPLARLAFRTCSSCYAMFQAAGRCPHCGSTVPIHERALPRSAGVDLAELPAPKPPAPPREWFVKMPAKRPGICASCAGPIRQGDLILWATLAKRARHQICQAVAA